MKIKLILPYLFKDKYSCLLEIIKGLPNKGQFQLFTKLKGPQEGTYLNTTHFFTKFITKYLTPS